MTKFDKKLYCEAGITDVYKYEFVIIFLIFYLVACDKRVSFLTNNFSIADSSRIYKLELITLTDINIITIQIFYILYYGLILVFKATSGFQLYLRKYHQVVLLSF